MAFLKKRKNSPYWWLSYRDVAGVRRYESTKMSIDSSFETKKARELCTQKTLDELKQSNVNQKELFDCWVPDFLKEHYHGRIKSYNAQLARWNNFRRYLKSKNLVSPRQVTFDDCFNYVKWRTAKPEPGYHQAHRNTAIHELKIFHLIMRQAMKRGYTFVNPASQLGLKKDAPDEKPEITDDEIVIIRDALAHPEKHFEFRTLKIIQDNRDWMSVAFEIAIHQGCRLTECAVPFRDIDFERKTITFDAKGDNRFTTALHPEIVGLLQGVKKCGKIQTCEIPPLPSKIWWRFFKALKFGHLCFHCTRVTVVTRMARQGVPVSQAMRYVGHASETIHRVYQRLSSDDLSRCTQALKFDGSQQNQDLIASNQ